MQTLTFTNNQVTEAMHRLRYFQNLPQADIELLANGICQVSVQSGEVVYRQGESVEFVSIVVSGQLKLSMPTTDGGTKVLAIAKREDSFGEANVLLDQPSPVSVEAVRDSHLLIIDKYILLEGLRSSSPLLALSALRSVSQRLLNMIHDTEMCHLRSSVDRVRCYLSRHSEYTHHGERTHLFPARKRDIAANLSMTPESFSRALRGLERQGVISVNGSLVQILDAGRLDFTANAQA